MKPRTRTQFAFAVLWCALFSPAIAETPDFIAQTTIFDSNHHHLWNRLHEGVFARVGPDQVVYGLDEPDPLLWRNTRYLFDGGTTKGLKLLGEFIIKEGAQLEKDPSKRAIMQSDLWSVFDWVADKLRYQASPQHTDTNEALARKLAQVIASLRMSAEDLKRLPETYNDAIESGMYANEYNPDKPHMPWLPPDLLIENGSWVNVGSRPNLIGEAHTVFASGRSVFLVLVRLPGGRASTLAYLDKLNNVSNPWIINSTYMGPSSPTGPLQINPKLPDIPIGTQLALVRRMVVIGDDNRIHPTHVVQSVQFRVYDTTDTKTQGDERTGFEFRLSRQKLFSGKPGCALRAVSPNEITWSLFLGHAIDPFESASLAFQVPPDRTIVQSCRTCHSPGIMGVQSYTRMFTGVRTGAPSFSPESFETIENMTTDWKQRQYDWGLLRGLMRY